MSWKQTAQYSFADALLIEHKSLSKLDNVHDSLHDFGEFEHPLGDRHGQVYADSAYTNKDNDEKLGKTNNRILHRAYRNTPLTAQQKAQNKMYSSVRYVVERTFGLLKLHHGLGKADTWD